MKKKAAIILTCFFGCIIFIVGLYKMSDKLNHRANGFIRLFPPHMVFPLEVSDLTYNSYYIAGATSNSIYFGNYTTLDYLLVCDFNFSKKNVIRLRFQDDVSLVTGSSTISIDSPHIYVTDGKIPAIFKGNLSDKQPMRLPHFQRIYFLDAVPISGTSYALKVYDRDLHESKIAKEDFTNLDLRYAEGVLEKQHEGLFSTDGILNSLVKPGYLVYTYYYRNQFICLDTNLNVIYKGRTIDTISQAQIKLSKIQSTKSTTFGAPPLTVNKHSSVNMNWILINSSLRANNEDEALFSKCSVIDVYSLKDGTYHFSFYLPDYKNKKIKSFKIFDNTIVALYDNYVQTFRINF